MSNKKCTLTLEQLQRRHARIDAEITSDAAKEEETIAWLKGRDDAYKERAAVDSAARDKRNAASKARFDAIIDRVYGDDGGRTA